MPTPALKIFFREKVIPEMMKSQPYKNRLQVPALEKIVVNSGVSAGMDRSVFDETVKELAAVTGQKPVVTRARQSVSNFKVREGMPVGVKVTLRGNTMYDFFSRLVNIALPGIRDFRGLSERMDGRGNYSIGIADHTIFPEVSMDTRKRTLGMDVTIVTTAETDDEGRELLRHMGIPFRKK